MDFSNKQSIYIQIAEYMEDRILENHWPEDEKIPSVRDLAMELQVNPNTVMRACEILQQHGIITNRRGLGNYVISNAKEKINNERKQYFLETELPVLFKKMSLLEIHIEDLNKQFQKYLTGNKSNNAGSYEKK